MKVLFIWNGTTHYFNLITSKINKQPDIEILYIYPKSKSEAIGDGVFQTKEGVNFKLFELEEKMNTEYNSLYYEGLDTFLNEHKPNIILTSEIHIKSLMFDERINKIIKDLNIKTILKSIPFKLEKYHAQITNLNYKIKNAPLPLFSSLPVPLSKLFKFIKLDSFYKNAYLDKKIKKSALKNIELQKLIYNWVDAHVNYIEEAYAIFGSYGVPKEKIFITYNSPDTDFLFSVKEKIEKEAPILPENKFRIIHLSRLVEWKRVDMLIRAVDGLRNEYPQIELVIVGEGPEKENLINLAISLGVSDSVKFLGGVYDPALLGKYLMSSSIYILAGMGGLSINDAMIFGLPVICSVCDGTEKYLVREGYNGLYFENGDQHSLESKIKYLFDHPEQRLTMGENSVNITKNEINIHTVVDGYMKAFNYITSGN
tara:strand:+ start:2322 stop:3602 length:1281 start_codon:yes stop_codon:yes gene_type:complete